MWTSSITSHSGYQSFILCGIQLGPRTSTATTFPFGNSENLPASAEIPVRRLRRAKTRQGLPLPARFRHRISTPTAGLLSGSLSDSNFTEETPHTSTDGLASPQS